MGEHVCELWRVEKLLGLSSLSWEVEPWEGSGESGLLLEVYTPDRAMPAPRRIGNLHQSSWQRGVLKPQEEVRDGTPISRLLLGFRTR